MDAEERRGGEEFDGKVAVANGVHRVGGYAGKPELVSNELAVEGNGGSGDGSRSEWKNVHAPRAVGVAVMIAVEHFDVREEVVGESDRLCALEMGVAGDDHVRIFVGEVNE